MVDLALELRCGCVEKRGGEACCKVVGVFRGTKALSAPSTPFFSGGWRLRQLYRRRFCLRDAKVPYSLHRRLWVVRLFGSVTGLCW